MCSKKVRDKSLFVCQTPTERIGDAKVRATAADSLGGRLRILDFAKGHR